MATLDQNNYRGMCIYLDGQYNTKNGTDRSVKHMENLAQLQEYNGHKPIYRDEITFKVSGSSTSGTKYYNSWSTEYPNFLNFEAVQHFPVPYYSALSVEGVFILGRDYSANLFEMGAHTKDNSSAWFLPQGLKILISGAYIQTHLQFLHPPGSAATSNSWNMIMSTEKLEMKLNKPYHYVVSYDSGSGEWKIYYNGVLVKSTTIDARNGRNINLPDPNRVLVGVGGPAYDMQTQKDWEITNSDYILGMLKVYNYPLDAEEVATGYQDAKKRFGVA